MNTIAPLRLPVPDEFGNFWLGDRKMSPAIFPSKHLKNGDVVRNGGYILFLGSEEGFLFKGTRLELFANAALALAYFNERST